MRTTMANIPTEVPLTARDRPGPGCGGMGQRYVEWGPGCDEGGTMPIFRLNNAGLARLAWGVDPLGGLERLPARLAEAGALAGASDHGTTKSLYAKDPDGLEFEVAWVVPAELLAHPAL